MAPRRRTNTTLTSAPVEEKGRSGILRRVFSWIDHKIYVYNVTLGLYMLDWWERYLFNVLFVLLLWFLCWNNYQFAVRTFEVVGQKLDSWRADRPRGSVNGEL